VPLPRRHVDGGRRVDVERRLSHVAGHANDGEPIALRRTEAKPLPEWVIVAERPLGERLTHHGNARCAANIVRIERASAQHGNPHDLEVFGRHRVAHRRAVALRVTIALEMSAVDIQIAAQRYERRHCGRLNARNRPHPVEHIREVARARAVASVLLARQLDLHREKPGGVESNRHGEDALNAAQQESRADEQH
jgi:hypothetical protein